MNGKNGTQLIWEINLSQLMISSGRNIIFTAFDDSELKMSGGWNLQLIICNFDIGKFQL